MLLKASSLVLTAAVLSSVLIPVGVVSAQSDPSLEKAWHQCLNEAIKQAGTDPRSDSQRVAIFKACMTRLGHAEGK